MAKKKKKKIVASVGLDGTITDYDSTSKNKKVVASVSLDGDIAPIKTTTKETTTTKKKDDSIFSAFDDGYDLGDVTKTILKGGKKLATTTWDTTKKIGKGLVTDPIQTIKTTGVSIAEGIDNTSKALDDTVDDFFDWLMKRDDDKYEISVNEYNRLIKSGTKEEKQEVLNRLAKDYGKDSEDYKFYKEAFEIEDTRSDTVKAIDNILNPKYYETDTYKAHQEGTLSEEQEEIYGIGEQVGAMLPSIAISTVTGNPMLGSAVFFAKAQQNYTDEAKARGYTDKDARIYGLIMGGAETIVERLGFDELGGLSKLSKGNILKNMTGEGLEEFIMPYIDSTVKSVGYDEKFDLEGTTQEAIEGGVMGAFTSLIMSSGGKGLVAVDNFVNKVNTGQEITQEDFVNAGIELQKADPNAINEIMEGVPQVVQQEIQKAQEQEQALKQQNYQYVPKETDSIQRKTISEDASKYANNTTRTQEFIDFAVNVSEASGINFRLANNEAELIAGEKNKLIERYAKNNNVSLEEAAKRFEKTTIDAYNNGEIVLNVDSPKALNRLVGHEVTHSLEGTQEYSNLQRIATEYAKTKGEYDSRISDLQSLYEGTNANIDNELTSDLIGDYLFTDQEFINRIHTEDRNLFQRIYDEIKHLYKMATAGSKEARQLEQLKHSFEKAMRENKESAISTKQKVETVQNVKLESENIVQKEQVVERTTPSQEELDNLEDIRQNKSGSEYADAFYNLEKKYGKANLYKGLNSYKTTGKALDTKHSLSQIVNEAIDDKGEDGRFDTEKNQDEFRDIIYEDYEKELGRELTDEDYNAIDEELYKHYKDGYYVSSRAENKIKEVVDGISNETNFIQEHEYIQEQKDYIKYNIDQVRAVKRIEEVVPQLKKIEGFINKLSKLTEIEDISTSRKSISTYISIDAQALKNQNIINLIRENGGEFTNKSIEELIKRDSNVEIRISDHESGGRGDKYTGNYIYYDSGDITIRVEDLDNSSNIQYSLSDNKGRKLSKEQVEFFKDSKVRDENGNLLTMYHGTTRGGFNTFNRPVSAWNKTGKGFYFTNDTEYSNSFEGIDRKTGKYYPHIQEGIDKGNLTPKTYEVYLDVKNPLVITKEQQDIIEDIGYYMEIFNSVRNQGYDGVMMEDKSQVFVYEPNQIKNVDNLNPTSDPDIRYSLSEDSEGRKLSDKQKEYFKDVIPELKDANGNLKVLYHGTPNDFTQFNYDYIGSNGTALGKGFYLAENINSARAYSVGEGGKIGKVMEVYANITKPMSLTELNISKTEFKKFIEAVNKATEGQYLSDYGEVEYEGYNTVLNRALDNYEYNDNDVDLVHDVFNTAGLSWEEGFRLLKDTLGYDGVVNLANFTDYKGDTIQDNVFVPLLPEQIKSVTNQNPTDNLDINLSLSNQEQNIAPTSADIYGSEIKLQQQVQEAIAPLQETIQELNNKITTLQENIAPIEGYTDEDISLSNQRNIENLEAQNIAPIEDTSPDIMPTNEVVNDPFEDRDIKAVGNRNVKAYMYENPEVKPFFQQAANEMLGDLRNSIKGEKVWLQELNQDTGLYQESMVTGTQRLTTDDIAELLDVYHYTYAQIEKGLNAIIEDNGKENNAVSKRIEFMLNDRLLNGYKSVDGFPIPPNNEYRALIQNNNIQEYTEQAYAEWNKNINQDELAPADIEYVSNSMPKVENVPIENDLAPNNINTLVEPKQASNEPRIETIMFADPVESMKRQAGRQIAEEMRYTNTSSRVTKSKNQLFGDAWGKLREQYFNSFHYVDKFASDTGNQQIKFNTDMYNNVYAEINGELTIAQTDSYGNPIGEALLAPFEEAKANGEYEQLNDYLMHYSNIDRHQAGKGSVVPLEYSRKMIAEYDKANPNLKEYARRVWRGYKNDLANMQSNGLISRKFNMTLQKMYPHYNPFMFEQEFIPSMEEDGVVRPKKVIKRAEGGAFEILEMEEARVRYTQSVRSAIRKNDVLKEIVKTSNEKISIGADVRTDPTNIDEGLGIDANGKYYATAYVNGEMQQAVISEDMYRELMQEGKQRMRALEDKLALLSKPAQEIGKWRRMLLTELSPTFIVTNFAKDLQDASFNSKYTTDFAKYYPTALPELMAAKTAKAKQFLTLYGTGNTYGEYDSKTLASNQKNSKFVKNVVNAVPNLSSLIELAPRFAEFKASLDHGCNIQEAMYNAREVTINFGRGGYVAKALNRNGFTFFNASLQGFDKLVRNFSGENGARGVVGALSKVAILGVAPALFNALAFGVGDDEDEDYKALPDYIKDNYYIIKTGDGEFIRIPKGRMLSIFGSAARRTLEFMQGEEDAFEGFLKNAYSQVGVQNPLESNIFAPLIQAYGSENGRTWYGTDLVPTRLQNEEPEDQWDESTDEFSKWLGRQLGISPYKINYVIDQYSGGIGDLLLPTITEEANSDGNFLAPIKDKFTANTTFDNKYVSEFYGTKEKLEKKSKSSRATDEDILKNKYMSSVSWEMSELYKEKREVQSNSDLTKAEKFKRVQEIQKQINALAEEGLKGYQNINKTSNYAIVNDKEYYKWTNDEGEDVWSEPKEEELDALNSYGLEIDEKNTYYITKNTIFDINERYKGSTEYDQKRKDIGQAIVEANLPDGAKYYLYDNFKDKYGDISINSDTLSVIEALGINANEFITYASGTFESDKDKYGEPIKDSKKIKVFNYINNMNIGFEEKVILAKLQYNSYDEWNHEIIEYLNNSGITYEEMEFILKKLGFEVDNEGNIFW